MRKRYTFSAEELEALRELRKLLSIKPSAKLPTAWALALLRVFYSMPYEDRHNDFALRMHIAFVVRVCSTAGYACTEAVRNVQNLLGGHDKASLLGLVRSAIECLHLIEAAIVATLPKEDGPPNGEPTKKP